MFLANLPDEQKKAFLSLAQAMISADGVLNEDETEMMEQYRKEMVLPAGETEAQPVESAMAEFKGASAEAKTQIVSLSLSMANFDRELDLDGELLDEYKSRVVKLADMYGEVEEIEQLVGKCGKFAQ